MKKVYISGPITGTDDYIERFEKAENDLKSQGYSVINPAKVNANLPEDTTWNEYMKMSLCMLAMCDGIYMLKGWKESRGANMELMRAKELCFKVLYEEGYPWPNTADIVTAL